MFLIVFALQQGQSGGWAPWIWAVVVAGIGFMTAFVYWQSVNPDEPLIPLDIFRDRDFSLCNLAGVVIGFVATAMVLPLMFYAQAVCGLSPTRSALLTAPMAITSGLLAPIVGKIVDRSHPRPVVGFGFSVLAIGLTWLSVAMTPSAPIWQLVLPFVVLGVGMAFIWSPLAATATRNLPPRLAGASSGVYNATRQVGAVLGSAGMASFMTSRITSHVPPMPDGDALGPGGGRATTLQLPEFLREPFSVAMSQSMLLPAFIALFGIAAALFMLGFAGSALGGEQWVRGGGDDDAEAYEDNSDSQTRRVRIGSSTSGFLAGHDDVFQEGFQDGFDDDDDYVEYTLPPAATVATWPSRDVEPTQAYADEDDTEPVLVDTAHPRPAPAEAGHSSPVDSWRSLLNEPLSGSEIEPIGFAHNGFHVDDEQRFQPIEEFSPPDYESAKFGDDEDQFLDDIDTYGGGGSGYRSGSAAPLGEHRGSRHRPSRHGLREDRLESPWVDHQGEGGRHGSGEREAPRNRHYRVDPDDTADYGRQFFGDS